MIKVQHLRTTTQQALITEEFITQEQFYNLHILLISFIPVIGLLDDALVIAICLAIIEKDLLRYQEWKEAQTETTINEDEQEVT